MKKYFKELKGFLVGVLITSILLFNTSVFAESTPTTVKALVNAVKVKINQTLMTSNNLMYNNKLYIQADEVAKLLGKGTAWDAKSKTYSINDKGVAVQSQSSKNIYTNLTDKEIEDALKVGSSGYYNATSYINSNYKLKEKSSNTLLLNVDVKFTTPYSYIIENKALYESQYKDYSISNAKNAIENFADSKQIYFTFDLDGNSIDFHKLFSYVLIQGDKKIKPAYVAGASDLAYTTAYWPEFPAYSTLVMVYFNMNEIDFSKKAELILVQFPEFEKHYEIDFSKYK